ncbi:MAG: hypothetical protein ACTTKH_04445 [Treponema sp.]
MNIISHKTIREEAISQKQKVAKSYSIQGGAVKGEMNMVVTGTPPKRLFTSPMFDDLIKKPMGEMNAQDLKNLVQQVIIDIASEQASIPPLYKTIYEEIVDSSFPASLEVKDIIGLQTAFGIVGDGESVPLGEFKCEELGTVHFKTYATGYSVTEEWVAFNQFWKIAQANKAIGQAHTAILDHIHLSPIISAEYKDDKLTKKETVKDGTPLQIVYASLRKGLKDAMSRKNSRGYTFKPTLALCNSSTALDVMSAIKGETERGKTLGSLGMIEKVVIYDGWAGTVNNVKYEFIAPKDNEVYLVEPKNGFKALVKKELTKIEQKGNVLSLSNLEVAEFFMRAVVADVSGAVHKVIVG